MMSLWKAYHAKLVHLLALFLTLLFSLASLVSCNQPAPLQYTSLNLGIPAAALQSPVKGPLPDSTELHVGITFKVDPRLLDQADQQKLQPGQPSNLEAFAKRLGIDDATYQKINRFLQPRRDCPETEQVTDIPVLSSEGRNPCHGCCKQRSSFTSTTAVRSTRPRRRPKSLPF